MDRREFLQVAAAVSSLAGQGLLPLLGAPRKGGRGRARARKGGYAGPSNVFAEPPAIEPVTGYLPKFKPVSRGAMSGAFAAKYTLVVCHGSAAKSRNSVSGSLDVAFSGDQCETTESRRARPANIVKTKLTCRGEFNSASNWTLESSIQGAKDLGFVEKGSWDGEAMVVKSKSWTQRRRTENPLIGRWALLPLLASGKLKQKSLTFDMLDDSTLRPGQLVRYTGEVKIPLAGGGVKLDCYAQTGRGVVPIHYLIDQAGRVQLITQSTVNWVLSEVKGTL